MKNTLFLLLFLTGILAVSCSKDVDEEINPIDNCNTESLSFQSDVLAIFDASCNGCHGSASNLGGVTLDTYEGVKVMVDSERLIGAISHDSGFSPMPKNATKLSDCNIDKVAAWVSDGAPNN